MSRSIPYTKTCVIRDVKMGWFSADEVVTPVINNVNDHHATQTVALCVLAGVALGYVMLRGLMKIHRQHTERVAECTTRRVAAQV